MPADVCFEVLTYPDQPGARASYTVKRWDAATRVLSVELSTTGTFAGQPDAASHYDETGRLLASATFDKSPLAIYGGANQTDYRYDTQRNLVEARVSQVAKADVLTPSATGVTS